MRSIYISKKAVIQSKKYPTPHGKTLFTYEEKDDKNDVWRNLKRDLFSSAHECGSDVISNGSSNNNKALRQVRCHQFHRKVRKSQSMPVTDNNQLQNVSLVKNQKNNKN